MFARHFPALLTALTLSLQAAPARAVEPAPRRALESLRAEAADALAAWSAQQPAPPTGLYLAFSADRQRAYALPACDDDGDPVVVVSDAALQLSETTAYALAYDRTDAAFGDRLPRWIGAVRRSDPSRRLPVAPAPFFPAAGSAQQQLAEPHATLGFRSMLAYWIALAATPHAHGELLCPAGDALREPGDAQWTAAEAHAAELRWRELDPLRKPARTRAALASARARGAEPDALRALAHAAAALPWRGPMPLAPPDSLELALREVELEAAKLAPPPPPPPKPPSAAERRARALRAKLEAMP